MVTRLRRCVVLLLLLLATVAAGVAVVAAAADANTTTPCEFVPAALLQCQFSANCTYGLDTVTECVVPNNVTCTGPRTSNITFNCRYCYQTPPAQQVCEPVTGCDATDTISTYPTNCTVADAVLCLGNRDFTKNVPCNWTRGLSRETAFFFSLFLGGFAADRFYLGYIGWGIFKLLTLGGFGVWVFVDVLLIGLGYLTPADGSLFV